MISRGFLFTRTPPVTVNARPYVAGGAGVGAGSGSGLGSGFGSTLGSGAGGAGLSALRRLRFRGPGAGGTGSRLASLLSSNAMSAPTIAPTNTQGHHFIVSPASK